MTIKDVLVYLDNDKDCANRIQTAISLSQHFDAHLAGLYVMRKLNVHPYPYTYIPAGAFEQFEAHAEERKEEVKDLFTSKTGLNDIIGEFRFDEGLLTSSLDTHSRYSDLLVIPREYENRADVNRDYVVSDILLGTVCPVLVLPEGPSSLSGDAKRVMLAWDGGQECARALRLALPLLSEKDSIDVVSISADETKADDIALHIARHGIDATVHILESNSFEAGSVLLKHATSLKSDLIVMGAYGHSRLRENLIGGVTNYMLSHSHLPVLFSH